MRNRYLENFNSIVKIKIEGKNIDKITQYANGIAQVIEKKSN